MVFKSPTASYWTHHQYAVEPPSPYFSYVIPLERIRNGKDKFGFIRDLTRKITSCPLLNERFLKLQTNAKFVELWAHNRPRASGHHSFIIIFVCVFQIVLFFRRSRSTLILMTKVEVVFEALSYPQYYVIAGDIALTRSETPPGGPSLVTNQKITNIRVATQGWLAHPRPKRLVALNGR